MVLGPFEAAWTRLLDVNEGPTVRDCATRAGIDADWLFAKLQTDDIGRRARDAVAAFDRDGCPGVPTWVVRGQRFWGKDRVEFLRYAIENMLRIGTVNG